MTTRCEYCQRIFEGPATPYGNLPTCGRACYLALKHQADEAADSRHASLEAVVRHAINVETGNAPHEKCALAHKVAPYIKAWIASQPELAGQVLDDPVFFHAFETLVRLQRLVEEVARTLKPGENTVLEIELQAARQHIERVLR